jgi:hypothetical protein
MSRARKTLNLATRAASTNRYATVSEIDVAPITG